MHGSSIVEAEGAPVEIDLEGADYPVDETIGGARVFLDRPLPFLCVYRHRDHEDDLGARLVTSQAAYVIFTSGRPDEGLEIVRAVVKRMVAAFGRCLVVELWEQPEPDEEDRASPVLRRPAFCISAPDVEALEGSVRRLAHALQRVETHKAIAQVEVACVEAPSPPGRPPIDTGVDGVMVIGVEVDPVYRNADTGEVFPVLFHELREAVSGALKQACLVFAQRHTSLEAAQPLALGPRTLQHIAVKVDRRLSALDATFAFLLQTTPVNAPQAFDRFVDEGCEAEPAFMYRPMPVDPELVKRRLYGLPIERVDDPALARLFREKQVELDRKVTMLRDRDTRRFFFGSLQLYGEVSSDLLHLAKEILHELPPRDADLESTEHLGANDFAGIAAVEMAYYHERVDAFPTTVQVRNDLPPGLMVSQGQLLIGEGTKVPGNRVEALLQHEVGTHMVTYYNGLEQPLQLLRTGLAGYEALQEGLAVLAEYLAGGLTVSRLRVLAARVVAAAALIDGAAFVDVFRTLRRTYDFEMRQAFSIAMRTFRGGGLIKDVIYMRGLNELLNHLRQDEVVEPLLIGKMALHHLPLLRELEHRQILRPAPLRPRFLDRPGVDERLARLRGGLTFIDLIQRKVA